MHAVWHRRGTAAVVRRLAVALLLLVTMVGRSGVALAQPATSDPLDLEWVGPPECPGRDTIVEQIRLLVGTDRKDDAPRVAARASVERWEDGRWHVRIVTLGDSGGERLLDAASCSALTQAVALVLAIRVKPTLLTSPHPKAASGTTAMTVVVTPPPPAPPPPVAMPAPVPVAVAEEQVPLASTPLETPTLVRPRLRFPGSMWGGLSAVGSTGELPSVDASAEVTVGYALGRARVELHGETGLVQDVTTSDAVNAPTATFRAAGGGVRPCYGPEVGRFSVQGCGDLEVDALWAAGHNYATSFSPNAAWTTLGALAVGRFRLTDTVSIRAFAEVMAPLTRPEFVVDTVQDTVDTTVHTPSAVWGRGGVGVDVRIF
jgi:hypothetical protein